jgi:type I restriction enzyme S subunit
MTEPHLKSWRRLGDISEIIMGQSPSGESYTTENKGVPLLNGAADFDGKLIKPKQNTTKPVKLSRKGDILLCIRATIGNITFSDKEYCLGRGVSAIRITDKMTLPKYIGFMLEGKIAFLTSRSLGSTIKGIRKDDLTNLEFMIPSLSVQERVVTVLERAFALKEKSEQANLMANKILQAAFLQMFGDPLSNPRKWKLMKLNQVGSIARGKSKHRPRNAPELLGGKYPLIQTGEIANCEGYIRKYSQTYSELGLKQSKMWVKGTLCITIAANIAATGILTFDACFPDSVVGFTPNENIRTEFVQHWLSFLQKSLEAAAPKSAQRNINLKILSELDVPTPPIELQNKFVSIVEKVGQLKEKQEHSAEETNKLFNSLISKAFKGELLQ